VSLDKDFISQRVWSYLQSQSTGEGSAKKLPGAEFNETCTIRIEISREKRIGGTNHIPPQDKIYNPPTTSVFHEDSKPALWGLNTV